MKRAFVVIFIALTFVRPAKADLFGGDVAVLTQILAQAIQQYVKLREILGTAQGQLDLIRQINQGINDSLNILKKIHPNLDPGLYGDWASVSDSLAKLEQLYGKVPDSPEARIQRDTDQGIAESVAFNNQFYKYTQELDSIGEAIQQQSHAVSPGGAAKLTAQALGLIIQVLNQSLRAQATTLKMHAQDVALRNRKEKAGTGYFLDSGRALKQAMKTEPVQFQVPRF
jgi:hypothetical protein